MLLAVAALISRNLNKEMSSGQNDTKWLIVGLHKCGSSDEMAGKVLWIINRPCS
jgi:hypothetical protein